MAMLSKMDKKDLEAGIAKANQILQSKNKDEILDLVWPKDFKVCERNRFRFRLDNSFVSANL